MLIDCDVRISPGTVLDIADYTDSATPSSSSTRASTASLPVTLVTDRLGAQRRLRPDQRRPEQAHDRPRQDPHAGARRARRDVWHRDARPHRRRPLRDAEPGAGSEARGARNDYILEQYLQPEPLRGLIAISPQNPYGGRGGTAASRARRVAASPAWRRAHPLRNRSTTRSRRPPTSSPCRSSWTRTTRHSASPGGHRRGYPDFYVEHPHALRLGHDGHFVSILCHGVFERFPNTKVMMVEGGLVPFVGLLSRLDTNWKACKARSRGARKPPSSTSGMTSVSSQPSRDAEDPSLLVPAIQGLRP